MKKILFSWIITFLAMSWVSAASINDDSIITEIDKNKVEELSVDFKMKSFDSCDAFEDVMETYMKSYWENNYKDRQYRMYAEPMMMNMAMDDMAFEESATTSAKSVSWESDSVSGWEDFSQTNTQVLWVDESDKVKTDGKYHYYFNETNKAVYIVDAQGWNLEIVKKINIPDSFYNVELYVTDERLAIIASSYSQTDYSKRGYYINRNSKTYTIVFDTSDISKPELIKLYSSDGDYNKSRRIGDNIYVLSRNYFNYPYYDILDADEIVIDAEKFLPQMLDISKTNNSEEQNLTIKGTTLPYSVVAGDMTDCNSISYSFPDEETLENSSFNPGYNIISVININDSNESVTTKVIAGSNSEIYMSNENLYMTEGIWQADNYSCPRDAMCAMPFFWGGTQNTLIHKLNIDGSSVMYQDSALVPGAPLNQYSMDEYQDNFRIITSSWSPERSTGLYILDENLESVSSLTNIAPGETFQSSRFIGDKLFLVTFEQIDPLFAIDLSWNEPEILWELKIPGFSTYLHPYDSNHLIGLGYDTQVNEWGGTQTAGLKVDLYKINYDKQCGDDNLTAEQEKKCESGDYKWIIVEQLYTQTLWGKWSYSEALSNPRMFVWNSNRNTLLLPATLYEKDDSWRTKDYYNGLFSIKIDKNSGIQVENKMTHIDITGVEEARELECKKYIKEETQPVCKELINGEMYCEDQDDYQGYIPNYCYADSTLWSYVWDKSWEYRDMQMQRALYIGESVYGISDSKITAHNWNLVETGSVKFK